MSLSYFNVKNLKRRSKQASPATSPPADTTHKTDDTTHKPDTVQKTDPSEAQPTVASPSEEPATSPILDEEDEKFLHRLASLSQEPETTPPPLPERPVGRNAQEALMDGADKVPLPVSPPETSDTASKRKSMFSYFNIDASRFKRSDKEKGKDKGKDKGKGKEKDKKDKSLQDRAQAADDLDAAVLASKNASQEEKKEQEEDLSAILDQLNLSAVNNRVFSFSKESEELLNKFKLVLKDLVNGVPTAYNDLESLLTESEGKLDKMYGSLPPFLQNLVKSLPAKMTGMLAPELLAASAEKPGFDAQQREKLSGESSTSKSKSKKSKRGRIPSLKNLVSAEGAVASMLRSILNFLKLRFPALMTGTNVLLSLAVFLLLFVFWYCHKRGKETRLEKERQGLTVTEDESALASSASSITDAEGTSAEAAVPEKSEQGEATKEKGIDDLPSVKDLPSPSAAAPKGK
ncbi:hypothetical protein M011DRAFT_527870 [Sporormia fimetaria CBS 119925]|uniref:Ring-like domain-containing protein n=1 Tax=Sporormia fimetaria CBS 119925 TaxID=1340428 RepID=A0A6A6V6E2_9PLEO|nr:hypothetical protein M011DRAFT_527870 [Sporormia fimetaria CBS 119925]